MRTNGRSDRELRTILLEPGVSKHAEGSCLARFGDTHVLCTATIEEKVPPHVFGTGAGWVTAEYGMLPRSTHERMAREAARGVVSELEAPADLPGNVAWVKVANGRRALATASANFYGRPAAALQLAGVTGTNGKTTTVFLIDSILRAAGLASGSHSAGSCR